MTAQREPADLLMARLVRERNRVADALRAASDDAVRLLHELEATA